MNQKTVNLGDEFDEKLWKALRSSLSDLGAKNCDENWGIGGSQELVTLVVELEGALIRIESETYMGLTVSGPARLVDKVQQEVVRKMA
jgi:hypothetical protein